MRGVPGMAGVDRFHPAICAGGTGQAIMLNVVGQMDLNLRMSGEGHPDQKTHRTADQHSERQGGGREQGVKDIGVQAGLGVAAAQVVFGGEACAERAKRGAGQVAPEARPTTGGGGVIRRRHVAVMDKAVAGCVMANQHPSINEDPEADMAAGGTVDQFMRGRVGDLAQPKAGGEK